VRDVPSSSTELTLKGICSARASLQAGPALGSHSEPTILYKYPPPLYSIFEKIGIGSNNILKMRGKVVGRR